jgi:broad specificity phosphatase PhoE
LRGDGGAAALKPVPPSPEPLPPSPKPVPDDPGEDDGDDPERLPHLVVVRHGQTVWSRQRRHTGRTDVPLDPEGRAQARRLGVRLAGRSFARVLVSPLARAQETCELAGFGGRAEPCEDLREWNYGVYEGRTTAEIRAVDPSWSLWDAPVPGGEQVADVVVRADRVIAAVRLAPGDTLAFAHAHLLRVVAARWLGLDGRLGAGFVLGLASVSILGWDHGGPAVEQWNEPDPDPT